MYAPSIDETRKLLIGTWITMAMVVETLIEQELVSREDRLLLPSEPNLQLVIAGPQPSPNFSFWSNTASARSI
jgi:hypothetical protein